MYNVICNYLHLNAGNAQVCLSSFQLNEELHCLLHIQQSPHCFDSLNKKMLHNTLTTHSKHAKCHKSLNSQPRCLCTNRRCLSFIRLCPSHNFLFLNNQTCCLETFVTKAHLYRFFLHQTQSKRDSNVREKAWRTLFTLSPVLDLPVRPSTREVGRVVGLAASYTRTSTDSNSTLLSSRIWISSDRNRLGPDSFSLINPQQSV